VSKVRAKNIRRKNTVPPKKMFRAAEVENVALMVLPFSGMAGGEVPPVRRGRYVTEG
jgi:hypothetical protein